MIYINDPDAKNGLHSIIPGSLVNTFKSMFIHSDELLSVSQLIIPNYSQPQLVTIINQIKMKHKNKHKPGPKPQESY